MFRYVEIWRSVKRLDMVRSGDQWGDCVFRLQETCCVRTRTLTSGRSFAFSGPRWDFCYFSKHWKTGSSRCRHCWVACLCLSEADGEWMKQSCIVKSAIQITLNWIEFEFSPWATAWRTGHLLWAGRGREKMLEGHCWSMSRIPQVKYVLLKDASPGLMVSVEMLMHIHIWLFFAQECVLLVNWKRLLCVTGSRGSSKSHRMAWRHLDWPV